MTFYQAMLAHLKDERKIRLAEIKVEVRRLRERAAAMSELSDAELVRRWAPFDATGDVGAGIAIWDCSRAAMSIASRTGRPVSFVFNEQRRTVQPQEDAE